MKKNILSLIILFFFAITLQNVLADVTTLKSARLVSTLTHLDCTEDSSTQLIYCFGGEGPTDIIQEYDPFNDILSLKQSRLPFQISGLMCAEDSSTNLIYCLGLTSQIIEYNPRTDTLIVKSATLPSGRGNGACAEDSSTHKIYCFGGSSQNEILEYDPSIDNLTVMQSTLPTNRQHLGCVENYNTNLIYCLGGESITDHILEFNPKNDSLIIKNAVLPSARQGLDCAFNRLIGNIYCFGGRTSSSHISQIVEYDPGNDNLNIMQASLPSGRSNLACAERTGTHMMYCFGGNGGSGNFDEIVEYTSHFSLPPVLNQIGNQTVNENETLTMQLTATEPENKTIIYSTNAAAILPSPFTLNTTSGLFQWTPTFDDEGIYKVTFSASSEGSAASETITITVLHVNRAPILNPIGTQQTTENQLLTFTVTGSDPDGNPIILSTNAATILPSPPNFDPQTGIFSWTPTYVDYGQYSVDFSITDGNLTATETITIDVLDAQTAKITMVGTATPGNTVTFFLSDPAAANKFYMMALSLGNTPGFTLADGRQVPLNPDSLFFTSLLSPLPLGLSNSLNIFNSAGNAIATWTIPNIQGLGGVPIHAGLLTIDNTQEGTRAIISIAPSVGFTLG